MSEGRDALLAEARDYLKAMCPAATEQDINVALNQFVSTADSKVFALALQTHIQQKTLAELHCKPGLLLIASQHATADWQRRSALSQPV